MISSASLPLPWLVGLTGLLLAGAYTDVRWRRVPNGLVLVLLVGAVGLALAGGRPLPASLAAAGAGFAVGLALWLPFWLLGLLGAGDVKYFAAAAAWIGPALAWRAALVAALLGGALALVVLARRVGSGDALRQVVTQSAHARAFIAGAAVSSADARSRTFPYAVPMAVALLLAAAAGDRLVHLLGGG